MLDIDGGGRTASGDDVAGVGPRMVGRGGAASLNFTLASVISGVENKRKSYSRLQLVIQMA